MQLFRHATRLPDDCRGSVAALGNFDGFHRGHQAVVGEAGRIAREKGKKLAVFTTEPHPRSFFSDEGDHFRLTPFRQRANLLESFGVDLMFVLPFDEALAATDAELFITDVLAGDLGLSHAVIGYDYRFGMGRRGDAALLREIGKGCGIEVRVVKPISVGVEGAAGEVYSSTLVRDALRRGEARRAAALLGHWWTVNGRVIEGDKRGRTIGFPTANMSLQESLVPAHGVYAVRVQLEGSAEVLEGVANVGRRPTFSDAGVLLEVHLFDFAHAGDRLPLPLFHDEDQVRLLPHRRQGASPVLLERDALRAGRHLRGQQRRVTGCGDQAGTAGLPVHEARLHGLQAMKERQRQG